jgi:serine phosphatase RsbU (regulator of sigma subunit)
MARSAGGSRVLRRERRGHSGEAGFTADLALARQVQANLFPQRMPPLKTLDYAGQCQEAQAIGGDYYDFLDLGRGRVGLVLGDVSGKGVYAALLMASLQASLRSQCALGAPDPAGLLRSVNRLFRECAAPGFFATLFFAEYNDARRALRYVNCGHHPPLLVRACGRAEKLLSTATVLGVFENWDCVVGEVGVSPGDVLVMYSDGITESRSATGEFFGEDRLVGAIREHASRPAAGILSALAASARQFGGELQHDDLTLVVARAR